MKQPLCLVFCLVILFTGCNSGRQHVKLLDNVGDTPYQKDTVLMTYATDPERALKLLDSALLIGNISPFNERICRATIYSKSLNEKRLDSALIICRALLQDDSVKNSPDNLETVLDLLISISRTKHDDNEYLKWATQKADLSRKHGEEIELLRTEAEIGMLLSHLGQTEEGLKKLDATISQLDQPGSIDRMDAFIIAVKRKITVLNELGRPADMIPLAQRILDRLNHYEQHVEDYAEDSYRLPWSKNPSDRDRYLDFYRAQANGFLAIAYAQNGNKSKARDCLALFGQSNYGKTFSARYMIIPAQMLLGMYDDVLATYDKMEQRTGNDTLNDDYATMLRNRAKIARFKGNAIKAYNLLNRHTNLAKLLSDSLHASQAHDYAARYHNQEQKLIIQENEATLVRMHIYITAAIIIALLILVIAIIALYQRMIVNKKNRILVQQIAEAINYKDKYEEIVMAKTNPRSKKANAADFKPGKPNEEDLSSINDLSDNELFDYLCHVIKREFLYLDPDLDRQKIVNMFQLSKRRVGSAFSQSSDFNSLPNFILACRLEFSCTLLVSRPDLSIKEVAAKSGFSYASTYSTAFRNHYTVTPTRYRELRVNMSSPQA